MARFSVLKKAGLIILSFLGLIALIIYLALSGILSGPQAGLMAVALFGLYVGFGILIAVYRFINKLD